MLQKGGKPRQQREHVAGGPQHHQTCSEGQSRRKARSGTIITTDAPEHAVTAHEAMVAAAAGAVTAQEAR